MAGSANNYVRARLLGAGALLAVAVAAVGAGAQEKATARAQARPNFVVIQTDDQTLASFRHRFMPRTYKRMVKGGTEFSDYVVTTPVCCPSRAAMLTGQYGHNNGVLSNELGYGALRNASNVLPTWLRRAGYRTGHVGKWLNGYGATTNQAKPAPGWSDWRSLLTYEYYNYGLSIDGRVVHHGSGDRDYLTRVLNAKATALIHSYARRDEPFYLQIDQFAPHQSRSGSRRCPLGPVPAPRDIDLYRHTPLPHPPSYNEKDVSDKRQYIRTGRASPGWSSSARGPSTAAGSPRCEPWIAAPSKSGRR